MANLLMGLVLWYGAGELFTWLAWGPFTRAWHLAALIVAGAGTYFLALTAMGIFALILGFGLFYVWKRGALEWD